jgi:hypothetical protein
MAATPARPDGEALARDLDAVESELGDGALTLSAAARLRERVSALADRAAWLPDEPARAHLRERAGRILDRLG